MSFRNVVCSAGLLFFAAGFGHAQWTRFRGPNGSGVAPGTGYPTEFSPSKNLVWKAAVPYGQSSPIIVRDRVFVTASDSGRLLTICLNGKTGRELWRREIRPDHPQKTYKANDPASPTPAADDTGVFVFFPDFGLVSYTLEGKERWRYPLGPFHNFYGMASSPIVVGDLVIQLYDQQSGSFVVALDRATGAKKWKTERTGETIGWATPMVFRPENRPAELIVLGSTSLNSYYLATGERRWWRPVATSGGVGTPLARGAAILVATLGSNEPGMPAFDGVLSKYDKDKDGRLSLEEFRGDPELGEHFGWLDDNHDGFIERKEWDLARSLGVGEYGAVSLQPGDAQGKLSDSAVRWRFEKNLPFIPTPLIYQDVFYMVKTGGIVTSLDPETGKLLKQGRAGALGEYYASPVAADGKLFLSSEDGKVSVLKSGAEWEVLSVNDLGEEIHATPALSDGRIYVRTRGTLYCFGK